MLVVVLLVVVLVLAVLAGVHWYVWRRLVRDTTARGGTARRAGAVAVCMLPLLSVGALVSGRAGVPFWLQQAVAWPGFMWLAVLLYLTLALVIGEAVRPLLRKALERRAPGRGESFPRAEGEGSGEGLRRGAAPDPAPQSPAGLETPETSAAVSQTVAGAEPAVGAPQSPAGLETPAGLDRPQTPAAGASEAGGGLATAEAAEAATTAEAAPPQSPGEPGSGLSRRLFVARVVGGGAAVAALGTVGYGTYGVLRGPRVKRVTVPLAKLPRAAHGLRIAVVSDIHLGPILGRAHTRRIVDSINAVNPDLIAVVGDLVDGSVDDLGPAAEPLAQLQSRHGAFFVTGNHEYFSGADEWVDHVRELGLRPLQNERVEIAGGFDLAGVNDIAGESEGEGPDFAKALGDRDRARAAVLLAHQPVVIHDAVDQAVDLQLSGHTHGGQLWPGNYLAELANPTVAGLERYGDTQLYVTRGAGAWGPPVRVGASSDITVLQLASKQA